MKYLTGYTDPFISPVTGFLARIQPLPDLQLGYVWIGDKDNRPTPSFKLIDLTIDLRSLEEQVDQMAHSTFVLNHPNPLLPKAQVLDGLDNGLMKNVLGQVEIAIPNQDYMVPELTWQKIWRGDIFGRPDESDDLTNLEVNVEKLEAEVTAVQQDVIELQDWRVAAEAQFEEILTEFTTLQGEIIELQAWQAAVDAQLEEMLTELITLQIDVTQLQAWQAAAEAQIAEMLLEIGLLQTQVTALEASVLALQTEVAALSTGLAALQEEVVALSATVAGLGLSVAALTLTSITQGLQISSLQSDVSSLQSAFDQATVTLLGDVVGIGLLNQAVVTKFSPDPVFTGNTLTWPSGDSASRPHVLVAGMFRYNTDPS